MCGGAASQQVGKQLQLVGTDGMCTGCNLVPCFRFPFIESVWHSIKYVTPTHIMYFWACQGCFQLVGSFPKGFRYFGILNIRWGVWEAKPLIIRRWGVWRRGRQPSSQEMQGGLGEQSPDQLSHVSISSVQYLFQFGQLCIRSLYETNLDVCEYELVPAAMYISVSRWHVHRLWSGATLLSFLICCVCHKAQ